MKISHDLVDIFQTILPNFTNKVSFSSSECGFKIKHIVQAHFGYSEILKGLAKNLEKSLTSVPLIEVTRELCQCYMYFVLGMQA